MLIAILGGPGCVQSVENAFDKVFQKLFGINRSQLQGMDAQFRNSQLLFESLPMLLLQLLIFNGIIDVGMRRDQ